jgi:hypothetical protein
VYECIFNGTFCNNKGDCTNGQCRCYVGWEGDHCEQLTSSLSADSTDVVLGAVLGSVIPVMLILAVLLVCLALVAIRTSRKKQHNEWEMNFEELELAEQLGAGGYAQADNARRRPSHCPLTRCVALLNAGTVSWSRPSGAAPRWP